MVKSRGFFDEGFEVPFGCFGYGERVDGTRTDS
jgi:hypothetical protein